MATQSSYYKQVLAIDNVTWTAVVPAAGSAIAGVNYISIKNPNAFIMLMRTNQSDPTTEDQIYPGAVETVAAQAWADSRPIGNLRFLNGTPVCYLQLSSGTGDAIITGLL
jgi:hypothetical protein